MSIKVYRVKIEGYVIVEDFGGPQGSNVTPADWDFDQLTLEDITLLTIGRFAPVPWFVMYPLGLILSWLVLGFLLEKMGKDTHKH